jgi:hypothetical protein
VGIGCFCWSFHFWFRYKSRYVAILQLKETDERLDKLFLGQLSRILMSFFDNPEVWNRLTE